jgi:hypothetical protein
MSAVRDWAIIVNNTVGNIVVSDAEFLESHPDWSQFEKIDITDLEIKPGIAWTIEDGKFKKPVGVLPENPEHILDDEWKEIEVPA